MPKVIKYKRPRKINAVSLTLAALLAFGVYMTMQYLPLYLLKSESYRILEETGSHFSLRKSRYASQPAEMEHLRTRMLNELRMVGVDDPDAEVWIEAEGREARFGVIYSKWVTWPFDVIEKRENVYEIEHVIELNSSID